MEFLKLMKKSGWLLLVASFLLSACELRLKPFEEESEHRMEVFRYDRLESQYLTTGDFSALQQMSTEYPMETRTLIEDILHIGEVNDPQINKKFLTFFQDSTLQMIVSDAESQYANMDDINQQLNKAFFNLKGRLPDMPLPQVYAQIGALDQIIVICNQSSGISLDKYLGEDYPLYKKFYSASQLKAMSRRYIVPDCLSFYLLSLYPMPDFEQRSQIDRDLHIGQIMWVCNQALECTFFRSKYINMVDNYMKRNKNLTLDSLLRNNDHQPIIKANKG